MPFKPVILYTDALIYILITVIILFAFWARKREHIRAPWRSVMQSKLAIISIIILSIFVTIGVLDSIHFLPALDGKGPNGEIHYDTELKSLLDVVISPLGENYEKTYSAPFAKHLFVKEMITQEDGTQVRGYPPLKHFHFFGTDKVGQDVFYQTIKSIRTGLVIGTLTTLIMLPFAILLGIMAGYFGGWIDDVIQYIYTTLSSIPGVLLIAAAILSLQVFISNRPEFFTTLAARADARLLALCLILGVTSWTGLCRMLRGETLKLREVDYIQAARALGVKHFRIIVRHILPNVMHIVLIAVVIDFSSLVLAEAVLSYVGVGVDPTSLSWGNMINSARLELAREPIVWWPLLAAFIFMFTLVLFANLFADKVRDAFDPRT